MNITQRCGAQAVSTCFFFFSIGKYFLVLFAIINLIKKISTVRLSKVEAESLVFFFTVFILFFWGGAVGLINGNDPSHIFRNNFGSIVFLLVGIMLFWRMPGASLLSTLDSLILSFRFWAEIFLIFYLIVLIYPNASVAYTFYLVELVGFNFHLSSLVGDDIQVHKIFSGLLVVYLFLIPLAFIRRGVTGRSWYIFVFIIVLSASFSQYLILIFYVLAYVFALFRGLGRQLFRKLIILGALVMLVFVSVLGGFGAHVGQKVGYLIQAYDEATISGSWGGQELNTVQKRLIQARVLLTEIVESPLLGKGLGYESDKYNAIREAWGEIKDYNRSMYELQFLDVPMKFGLPGALLVMFLFVVYPVWLILSINKEQWSQFRWPLMIGYLGVVLYSLNNGNYFYSYATMFCWGVATMISLQLRSPKLAESRRAFAIR